MSGHKRIETRIQKLAAKRQLLWSTRKAAAWEVEEVTRALDEAYAELRLARARSSYGPQDAIRRRARTERELEKLMTA